MTIEDLEDWLKGAWRISEQAGKKIGSYEVLVHGSQVTDLKIDHVDGTLDIYTNQ